jgi:type II secretory pathway component PulC
MRQPFWILNSSLLVLALASALFIYFGRPSLPEPEDITPIPYAKPSKTETAKVNINSIYENDLFDTYQKELIPPSGLASISPAPEPPSPMAVRVPEEPKPQFIEPLPITLKGIIIVHSDDTKNRVIIMDNRTGRDGSYKVGDTIEDAQLIRIFSNKAIFMRSNGQQEVLYLREKDAKIDPMYANTDSWENIITLTSPYHYTINTAEFINRVQSLGQFIDMVEMVTAYKQGESVGCRITNTGPGSLGTALGFTTEDIIIAVNDTPTNTTQNRLLIYKKITALKTNDVINVTLLRNNNTITLSYTLQEVTTVRKPDVGQKPVNPDEITQAQRKQLEQKNSFAPTLNEIRNREKTNMLEKSKRPTHNVLSTITE